MYLWNGFKPDDYPLPIDISSHQQWHALSRAHTHVDSVPANLFSKNSETST